MEDPIFASAAAGAGDARAGWPTRLVNWAAGLAAAGIVMVVLIQVVGRVANSPVPWSEELTRALFIWMVFLGMASSMRSADAARITILLERMHWLRPLATPIYLAGCLAFFGLMGWTGVSMVRTQIVMNESYATLGWPSWVVGVVMPISAIIATIATVGSLRDHYDLISARKGVST